MAQESSSSSQRSSISRGMIRTRGTSSSSSRTPSSSRRSTRENSKLTASRDVVNQAHIVKLPVDVLCRCFAKLDSIYDIIACTSVCRGWREAFHLDMVWKDYYLKWHEEEQLPSNAQSWRDAFIKNIAKGRAKLLSKTTSGAVEAGLLQVCAYGGGCKFTPGVHFQLLAEQLQLRFYLRINHGPIFRVSARGDVRFPASCILQCPIRLLRKSSKLMSLTYIEVGAFSDQLSQSYRITQFEIKKEINKWEDFSELPLRLLQLEGSRGTRLVVGTLAEDSPSGNEEILFIKVALHMHLILDHIFKAPVSFPRIIVIHRPQDDNGYHVSIQLHTFDQLLWTKVFNEVCYARETVSGETIRVLQLISNGQVIPQKCSLPWRSEAFSGDLHKALLVTFTLWNSAAAVGWSSVKFLHFEPVFPQTVEYSISEFEGTQFQCAIDDAARGVSALIKCSIPQEGEPVFAVTNISIRLSRRFTF